MLRWLFRIAFAGLIVGGLVYAPYRLAQSDGYAHLQGMRSQLADLDRGNEVLRDENRALRREVLRLRGDLDAIAAVARDELGLVMPGDVVIQIDRGAAPSAPVAPAVGHP